MYAEGGGCESCSGVCFFAELANLNNEGGDLAVQQVQHWLSNTEGWLALLLQSSSRYKRELPPYHHAQHGGAPHYFTQGRIPSDITEAYESDGVYSINVQSYVQRYTYTVPEGEKDVYIDKPIKLAVAGIHGSTTLEPVAVMKTVANVEPTFFGHPCPGGQVYTYTSIIANIFCVCVSLCCCNIRRVICARGGVRIWVYVVWKKMR